MSLQGVFAAAGDGLRAGDGLATGDGLAAGEAFVVGDAFIAGDGLATGEGDVAGVGFELAFNACSAVLDNCTTLEATICHWPLRLTKVSSAL